MILKNLKKPKQIHNHNKLIFLIFLIYNSLNNIKMEIDNYFSKIFYLKNKIQKITKNYILIKKFKDFI